MDNKDIIKLIEKVFFCDINQKIKMLFDENKKLVHYTSALAACNVIEKEELWMRKTIFMNDYSEIFYGKTCMDNIIRKKYISDKITSIIKKFDSNATLDDLLNYYISYIKNIEKRTYISCLSEHLPAEDDIGRLSMWRAYAASTGVALIINPRYLKEETIIPGNFFITMPVTYSENSFEKIFLKILDNIDSYINELKVFDINQFFTFFAYMMYIYVISIKHRGFAEEREWRIILSHIYEGNEKLIPNDLIERSIENTRNIPEVVYKIKLDKYNAISSNKASLLEKIIIGPSACAEIVAESFAEILQKKGFSNAKNMIAISNIPLRC